MNIRFEQPADIAAIHEVNRAAFGTVVEADLVNVLRREASPIVSLVADDGGAVIGHILFSPVALSGHEDLKIMGLAPMAVRPAQQRRGIGSLLVLAGLDACRQLGFGAAVVLGHAGYYPRFGFTPASRVGVTCEYEVPDDVFMILELEPGILGGKTGTIRYHPAFGAA
jgi:putative acetyltransferase